MIRFGKCLIDVARRLFHESGDVIRFTFVNQRRARRQRFLDVHAGRHGFIIDLHQWRRILGELPAGSDDDRHRLADVAHLVPGQRKFRERFQIGMRNGQRKLSHCAQILEGNDIDDPRRTFRRAGVDAQDLRVRMGASDNMRVQHAGKIDVIDKHSLAGQQFVVFRPLHRRADELRRRRYAIAWCEARSGTSPPEASTMALTIF